MLTVPEGSVFRLFSAQVFRVAGAAGEMSLNVRDLVGVPNLGCKLAPNEDTTVGNDGNRCFRLDRAVVVPAGLTITGDMFLGSPSILQMNMYGCLAPAGTTFYC